MVRSDEGPPPVEVRNLNKRYKDGTRANRDITLTIERGELLGIVGPNGAGKTTLVRQITTELLPTSGEVRVFGHDVVTEPSVVKGYMGVMPQEANLYWRLTVRHHLRIFAKLRGLSRRAASRRADELISDLRLEEHRNKPQETLSGGLRRRLLLGIASLAEPPLLVLDEPTAGLDPRSRHDLWDLLRSYKRRGAAVLLTTHNMEEAEALCDRVGIIQDGLLMALDTVDNLRAAHGFNYKVTYESSGRTVTLYGADDRSLVQKVQAEGYDQYAVSRATLEDVYLALTEQEADSAMKSPGRE